MSRKKAVETPEESEQVELQNEQIQVDANESQGSDENTEPPKDKHTQKCEQIAQAYAKIYPEQIEFHITNDFQVFLGGDVNLAHLHQSTINEGELKTIKIN